MKNNKSKLSLACAICITSNSQALTIEWSENSNPSIPFPASLTVNNTAFNVNTEFRIINSGGIAGGGHKSIVDGARPETIQWNFDDTSGEMISVSGTDVVAGAAFYQPQNAGVTASGDGLFLNEFFLGATFGFLAPFQGSDAANLHGAATLSRTDMADGPLVINFPVLEAHWNQGAITAGSASNGVNLNCMVQSGVVECTGEHMIMSQEDVLGFAGQWIQFDLKGKLVGANTGPRVDVKLNIQGGNVQECSGSGGNKLNLTANLSLFNMAEVSSIEWFLNNKPIGTGETITSFAPLGVNLLDVVATLVTGQSDKDTKQLTVRDMIAPELSVGFIDEQSGELITSVVGNSTEQVAIQMEASDICDPNPTVSTGSLTPVHSVKSGDTFKVKGEKGTAKIPTSSLRLSGSAVDASGNHSQGNAILTITE